MNKMLLFQFGCSNYFKKWPDSNPSCCRNVGSDMRKFLFMWRSWFNWQWYNYDVTWYITITIFLHVINGVWYFDVISHWFLPVSHHAHFSKSLKSGPWKVLFIDCFNFPKISLPTNCQSLDGFPSIIYIFIKKNHQQINHPIQSPNYSKD